MSKLFKPLYDRLLVQRDEEETTMAGGIFIPDGSKDKPDNGRVLAVGHGRLLESGQIIPMVVSVGDRIAFHKYAGSEIKIDGKTFLIMDESEVFGIYPKGEISE